MVKAAQRLVRLERIKHAWGRLLCWIGVHDGEFIARGFWSTPKGLVSNDKADIYLCRRCQANYIKDVKRLHRRIALHTTGHRKRFSRYANRDMSRQP